MTARGDRVRLVHCTDQHTRLTPGTEGTVVLVDGLGTVHVRWDDGSTLGMIASAGDAFTLIPADPADKHGSSWPALTAPTGKAPGPTPTPSRPGAPRPADPTGRPTRHDRLGNPAPAPSAADRPVTTPTVLAEPGCDTGKRRYANEARARAALALIARDTPRAGRGGKRARRAYECHLCHGWHLTSHRSRRRK